MKLFMDLFVLNNETLIGKLLARSKAAVLNQIVNFCVGS